MKPDNRNMILAIALSLIVLFGWQFFIAGPQMERAQRQAQIAAEQAAAANPGIATTTTTTAGTAMTPTEVAPTTDIPATFADRAAAIAASSRVSIDTPAVIGSINQILQSAPR